MIRAFLHGLFDGWNACDTLAVIVIAAFLLSLLSCASTFKTSGVPGCARGHTWSDSAWACVPRDSSGRGR